MKKYIWIVNTVTEAGKHYSHAWRLSNGSELISQMKSAGIQHAHLCGTKKEACELAAFWNDCYKENGTYMFAGGPF